MFAILLTFDLLTLDKKPICSVAQFSIDNPGRTRSGMIVLPDRL
jgi:hypothetical protein